MVCLSLINIVVRLQSRKISVYEWHCSVCGPAFVVENQLRSLLVMMICNTLVSSWLSLSTKIFISIVEEYVDILLSEYDDPMAERLTKKSSGDEDRLFYDTIQICGVALKSYLNGKQDSSFTTHTKIDQILRSQSLITLDQLTPLTLGIIRKRRHFKYVYQIVLGVLMDIYQKSLFFEHIIRQNCDIASNDNFFHPEK